MKTENWLKDKKELLAWQVEAYNKAGAVDNADIAQGQIDLIDEILKDI